MSGRAALCFAVLLLEGGALAAVELQPVLLFTGLEAEGWQAVQTSNWVRPVYWACHKASVLVCVVLLSMQALQLQAGNAGCIMSMLSMLDEDDGRGSDGGLKKAALRRCAR